MQAQQHARLPEKQAAFVARSARSGPDERTLCPFEENRDQERIHENQVSATNTLFEGVEVAESFPRERSAQSSHQKSEAKESLAEKIAGGYRS